MLAQFDPSIILLSFGISALGSYVCISSCEQYRLFQLQIAVPKFLHPRFYLAFMAISLGLVGIWCMHFVGMSALTVHEPGSGRIEPIKYDLPLTILSLVLVIIFASAGVVVASYDRVFTKTKREITQMFVARATNMTISRIRKISALQLVYLVATKSLQHLVGGGLLAAAGVCVMHYVGMSAMRFRGYIEWDYGIVAASVIIAFLAATAAFWILFRLLSIFPCKELLRISSSVLMAIAVCGMHYTGMLAARFKFDEDADDQCGSNSARCITSSEVYAAGFGIALLLSMFLMIILLGDMRFAVHRLSSELARADDMVLTLNMNMERHSRGRNHVLHYLHRRRLLIRTQDSDEMSIEPEDLAPVLGGFVRNQDDVSVSTVGISDRTLKSTATKTEGTHAMEDSSKTTERNAEHSVSFIDGRYRSAVASAKESKQRHSEDDAVDSLKNDLTKPSSITMPNGTLTSVVGHVNCTAIDRKIYPIFVNTSCKSNSSSSNSVNVEHVQDKYLASLGSDNDELVYQTEEDNDVESQHIAVEREGIPPESTNAVLSVTSVSNVDEEVQ